MIDTPEIVETQTKSAAVIHITIPRDQMQRVMGPAVEELMETISKQGRKQRGPLFAHHLKLSPTDFDFEVGIPVDVPVTAAGRVRPGKLPAARVARTTYRGPYEGLFGAWDEFGKWTEERGLKGKGTLWECYVKGPESDADPSTWRTELNLPLLEG